MSHDELAARIAAGDELWPPAQVARFLGYKQKTLRNWRCARKNLPFVTLNNEPRYWRSDVECWFVKNLTVGLEAAR